MTNKYHLALKVATEAHKGQKRKDGEDYIQHCIRVSDRVFWHSEYASIVGLLHDVVEDTHETIESLAVYGFDPIVISAVDVLTRKYGQSYLDYINGIKHSEITICRLVKLADLEDNPNGAKGTLKDKYEMARWMLTN